MAVGLCSLSGIRPLCQSVGGLGPSLCVCVCVCFNSYRPSLCVCVCVIKT